MSGLLALGELGLGGNHGPQASRFEDGPILASGIGLTSLPKNWAMIASIFFKPPDNDQKSLDFDQLYPASREIHRVLWDLLAGSIPSWTPWKTYECVI